MLGLLHYLALPDGRPDLDSQAPWRAPTRCPRPRPTTPTPSSTAPSLTPTPPPPPPRRATIRAATASAPGLSTARSTTSARTPEVCPHELNVRRHPGALASPAPSPQLPPASSLSLPLADRIGAVDAAEERFGEAERHLRRMEAAIQSLEGSERQSREQAVSRCKQDFQSLKNELNRVSPTLHAPCSMLHHAPRSTPHAGAKRTHNQPPQTLEPSNTRTLDDAPLLNPQTSRTLSSRCAMPATLSPPTTHHQTTHHPPPTQALNDADNAELTGMSGGSGGGVRRGGGQGYQPPTSGAGGWGGPSSAPPTTGARGTELLEESRRIIGETEEIGDQVCEVCEQRGGSVEKSGRGTTTELNKCTEQP